MNDDKLLLKRAIEIAKKGVQNGGGPFGAVVAKDGKVIAESYNMVVSSCDPTAHAEILAIRGAALHLKLHNLSGCTLYSSCEPCPMCLSAVYWAGIKRVVYSSDRMDAERHGFSDTFIYREMLLPPEKRDIEFIRIILEEGEDVFRKWDDLDNKILY